MLIPHAPAPSKVLTEIQMMAVAELCAGDRLEIPIRRSVISVLQAVFGELIGQIEVLEEGAAAADRLAEELRIVGADRDRWRTAAETYRAAWAKAARGSTAPPRPRPVGCGADVVDLVEILRREHRDAGRPIGPEGGAA